MSDFFYADVLQFIRPNGRQVLTSAPLPISCEKAYDEMRDSGCRFEAEVLTTNHVLITISNNKDDLDISITDNGPEVQAGMVAMLERRKWKGTK